MRVLPLKITSKEQIIIIHNSLLPVCLWQPPHLHRMLCCLFLWRLALRTYLHLRWFNTINFRLFTYLNVRFPKIIDLNFITKRTEHELLLLVITAASEKYGFVAFRFTFCWLTQTKVITVLKTLYKCIRTVWFYLTRYNEIILT